MMLQEIILNIMFSGLASIAFFYVYKKTHLYAMLAAGAITYFELLTRLFAENIPTFILTNNLLIIPETIIIIYMLIYVLKEGFRWIPLMLVGLLVTFLILLSIGHTFYGDVGAIFGPICIIWVNQSTTPCNNNPWECKAPNKDHCARGELSGKWRL
jgi:hypothetical protein